MKKIILVIYTLLCFSIAFTACKSSPTPKDVVVSYCEAMQNEDYETALSYTTVTNPSDIKRYVDLYQSMGTKITSFEILSENISEDGTTAAVSVKIASTYAGAFSDEVTQDLKLVKQGNNWLIEE